MEPMKPMKPMVFKDLPQWWPQDLGAPNSAGAQNSFEYAYFAKPRRLLIREGGKITTYDTGDHDIDGVSQSGESSHAQFTSEAGAVQLSHLKRVG